ncbi:MAG TPA: glutathione S-transferase family protein [Steroidobacteraceae bacterium]|nr:glutathione S-transferase family protein [Steroidobacteraceae bacterium]
MLDLYHWEPHGASARVLIALEEKGLPFTGHYVDVLAFEHHRPQFLKLDANGRVPILVHDEVPYTDATAVCEYLEEAFEDAALMPQEPAGRWQVRAWQKYVDDAFAASVSELAWDAYGARALAALPPDALRAAIERIPAREQREAWSAAVAGLGAEPLARARDRVTAAIRKIEAALGEAAWLAGPRYSLADIAVFSYFKYLPALCPALLSEAAAPRALSWMRAVEARPGVRAALARGRAADAFAVAAPGPEQVRWG